MYSATFIIEYFVVAKLVELEQTHMWLLKSAAKSIVGVVEVALRTSAGMKWQQEFVWKLTGIH
jgi:hypothetical protein